MISAKFISISVLWPSSVYHRKKHKIRVNLRDLWVKPSRATGLARSRLRSCRDCFSFLRFLCCITTSSPISMTSSSDWLSLSTDTTYIRRISDYDQHSTVSCLLHLRLIIYEKIHHWNALSYLYDAFVLRRFRSLLIRSAIDGAKSWPVIIRSELLWFDVSSSGYGLFVAPTINRTYGVSHSVLSHLHLW